MDKKNQDLSICCYKTHFRSIYSQTERERIKIFHKNRN